MHLWVPASDRSWTWSTAIEKNPCMTFKNDGATPDSFWRNRRNTLDCQSHCFFTLQMVLNWFRVWGIQWYLDFFSTKVKTNKFIFLSVVNHKISSLLTKYLITKLTTKYIAYWSQILLQYKKWSWKRSRLQFHLN